MFFKGSDDRLVQVDELVAQLNAFNCPALKGKPKLFLIQACRGGNKKLFD